jgi:hypothetical protein
MLITECRTKYDRITYSLAKGSKDGDSDRWTHRLEEEEE